MKKLAFALLALTLSAACAFGPLVPVPTPTPAPTQTDTATPLPTPTPATPTLTFTFTPTLIGLKTPTFTPRFSLTPEASITAFTTFTLTASNTAPPPVKTEGFISITISLTDIYKAKGCEPSVARISAQVVDSTAAAYVLLFARFKSKTAERVGKWTKFDMIPLGAGTYIFDLSSDQIKDDAYFDAAWIEYQIVSTTQAGSEIGRTDIFKERLTMLACDPNATPSPVTATPTP
ncbi:MAG: hypothetical protein IT309_03145 [Anaerolineales bacterium]|jgi:hypothetical protein|nr:hypothetical protein [Anaerolineales bacterium]